MSAWEEKSISELAAGGAQGVSGGPFGSSLGRKDYVEAGVPVVRGAQLAGEGRFSTEGLVFVTEEKADRHRGNLAGPGDVLVTQRGTLGQVGLIPDDLTWERLLLSQSQMKITPAPDAVDGEFLYYALLAPENKRRLIDLASAAGVPHINLETLREFKVRVPSVEYQRRIAAILSSFDRLIEICGRRRAILGRLAESVYRNTGREDWALTSVGEVAEVIRGRSYRRNELSEECGNAFLTLKCVEREGGFRLDGVRRYTGKFKEAQRAVPGDILVAVTDMTQERRIVARAFRLPDLGEAFAIPSLDLALVRPFDPEIRTYLYATIRYGGFGEQLRHYANGANVLHLGIDHIEQYKFPMPPTNAIKKFSRTVEPLLAEGELLEAQMRALGRTRDLLLPRLVGGALDISDLELDALEQ